MADTFCGPREDFSLNVGIFPHAAIVNNSRRMAVFILVLSSGGVILFTDHFDQ